MLVHLFFDNVVNLNGSMLNLYVLFKQNSGHRAIVDKSDIVQWFASVSSTKREREWESKRKNKTVRAAIGVLSEKLRSHFHFQGYEFVRLNSIKKPTQTVVIFFFFYSKIKNDTNRVLNDSILHL